MKVSCFVLTTAFWAVLARAEWMVDPPTTADPNTPEDCTWWHIAEASDTCSSISDDYFITEPSFVSYVSFLVPLTAHIYRGGASTL